MSNTERTFSPQAGDALILVDVQKDFLPGGLLALAEGDRIIAPLNRYIQLFQQASLPVFVTRDWHPQGHCSFTAQGGPWPPHCQQNTVGAEFADALQLPHELTVISKATHRDKDAYSGFDGTQLHDLLQRREVKRLWVGGLATDVCVLNTVTDACKLNYQVLLLEDAIAAVNQRPQDGVQAIQTMKGCGANAITLSNVTE